jgi:hypothetical protein
MPLRMLLAGIRIAAQNLVIGIHHGALQSFRAEDQTGGNALPTGARGQLTYPVAEALAVGLTAQNGLVDIRNPPAIGAVGHVLEIGLGNHLFVLQNLEIAAVGLQLLGHGRQSSGIWPRAVQALVDAIGFRLQEFLAAQEHQRHLTRRGALSYGLLPGVELRLRSLAVQHVKVEAGYGIRG